MEGMLAIRPQSPVDAALELSGQIPSDGEAAYHRVRALARLGAALGRGNDPRVPGLFKAAYQVVEKVAGADQQARSLAFLARLAAPYQNVSVWFSRARQIASDMPAELDRDTQEAMMTANLTAQTAMEADWNMQRTPYDTLGARVRAIADVAAEMIAAGVKAEDVFTYAEVQAATITGRPMDEIYRQHTLEYIAARRTAPADEALPAHPRPLPELEVELLAHERVPPDRKGYYARLLVNAAHPLAAAGDPRAAQVLEQAASSLDEVEGGYRAQILLEIARLERRIGREDRAGQLEQQAEIVARSDPGLLGGYPKWLAQVGRTHAASLREIGNMGKILMKSRYFSDQALANLAITLAEEDLEGATLLANEIQDDLQRARAYAGIAAQAPEDRVKELLGRVSTFRRELDERQASFVLYEAVLAAAPLKRETALELARSIKPADLRASALVQTARAAEIAGQPAGQLWFEASEAARQALEPVELTGASLAYALAALGEHSVAQQPEQAESYWQAAVRAANSETGDLLRVSALTEIGSSMRAARPEQAVELLDQAARLARQLEGLRDCGRAMSAIAALLLPIHEDAALENLAGLRSLGRVNFLDGLAELLPPAVERYGPDLAWQVVQAVGQAEAFF